MIDYDELIIAKTEWTPLNRALTGKGREVQSLKNKLNVEGAGVYQLVMNTDLPITDYVAKCIGYTGMSKNVFSRVGGIIAPAGKHGMRSYIHQNNLKHEDISIRYMFTADEASASMLEKHIHNEMNIKYGYDFKWRAASGGNDGVSTRIMTDLLKIDNPADLIMISQKAKSLFADIMFEAAVTNTMPDVINDYFSEE